MATGRQRFWSFDRSFIRLCLSAVLFLVIPANSRLHTLDLKNDARPFFALTTFGFFKNGVLEINLRKFSFAPYNVNKTFGFSLDKTVNDAISPYLESHQDRCVLEDEGRDMDTMSVIFFTLNLTANVLQISCSKTMMGIHISQSYEIYDDDGTHRQQRAADKLSDSFLIRTRRAIVKPPESPKDIAAPTMTGKDFPQNQSHDEELKNQEGDQAKANEATVNLAEAAGSPEVQENDGKAGAPTQFVRESVGMVCGPNGLQFPINKSQENDHNTYKLSFIVRILDSTEEGLYNLYFHNCPDYNRIIGGQATAVNLTIDIIEMNDDNYLSAGQMPLPAVYFTMCILFFLSGCFWIFILRKSSSMDVFKIHYLMTLLVYVKSFSLLFHGINFHFIQAYGYHIEGWAVLYYVTHLLKGALLFITIVLIGTGWAFIKHILSDKDKKIFMIVIPLQVLANVAEIIIDESEEGDSTHTTWREVFILVDLLCCGAILFPVVWSIRHLQEASQTDGKAAVNLRKLKLFRHFYIMIVCYIYFTRIIVYLLKITVPFKYEWLDEMFKEMATFVFFVLTGYKFRPASNNPYFQLSQEDDELEMDEVLTQTGMTAGITKMNRFKHTSNDGDNESNSSKRESSHEYD